MCALKTVLSVLTNLLLRLQRSFLPLPSQQSSAVLFIVGIGTIGADKKLGQGKGDW